MTDGTPPAPPALSFAFAIRADIAAPIRAGTGPLGERLHIAILGGTVTGPRLNGRILPGGSDWALLRADGSSMISAHYSIEADDGTPILVRNEGLRVSSPAILKRLQAGETVSEKDYYFRSTPRLEAPHGVHQWLNDTIFVATLMPAGRTISIDVFSVD